MKALFLLLALVLCLYLALGKARSARSLMTFYTTPEMLVGPDQHTLYTAQAIVTV
jgi:hypothetical protein